MSIWLQTQNNNKKEHSIEFQLFAQFILNLRPWLAETGRIVQDTLLEKAAT